LTSGVFLSPLIARPKNTTLGDFFGLFSQVTFLGVTISLFFSCDRSEHTLPDPRCLTPRGDPCVSPKSSRLLAHYAMIFARAGKRSFTWIARNSYAGPCPLDGPHCLRRGVCFFFFFLCFFFGGFGVMSTYQSNKNKQGPIYITDRPT